MRRKRPTSITVIAILEFIGVVAALLLMPPVGSCFRAILWFYVFRWAAFSVGVAYMLVALSLGVGLLRCRPWARSLAIAFYAWSILDSLVARGLPGSFERYLSAVAVVRMGATGSTKMGFVSPTSIGGSTFHFWLPVLVGTPIWVVFIYFLWTRRAAFYPPTPVAAEKPQV